MQIAGLRARAVFRAVGIRRPLHAVRVGRRAVLDGGAARARRRRRARALGQACSSGYTESLGLPALRDEIASLYRWPRPPTTSSRSPVPRKGCSSRCTRCSAPGDHAVVVVAGVSVAARSRAIDRRDGHAGAARPEATGRSTSTPSPRQCGRTRGSSSSTSRTTRPARRSTGDSSRDSIAIAELHGAHLFSDEVYRFLEHELDAPCRGRRRCSSARISLGVMSKPFGLAGLRIGWIATRDRALRGARRGAQGLHDDLQQRAERDPRAHRAARARTRVLERSHGDHSRRNSPLLDDILRARKADTFDLGPSASRERRLSTLTRRRRRRVRRGGWSSRKAFCSCRRRSSGIPAIISDSGTGGRDMVPGMSRLEASLDVISDLIVCSEPGWPEPSNRADRADQSRHSEERVLDALAVAALGGILVGMSRRNSRTGTVARVAGLAMIGVAARPLVAAAVRRRGARRAASR